MRTSRISDPFGLFLAVALVHGLAGAAFAQPHRRIVLDYQRQEGAAACPETSAIQVGVAARLGYDPFDEKAGERLRVAIRQAARGLEARIEMDDADGKPKAERRLVSRQRDCKELAFSVELAISIAIDPSGSAPPAAGAWSDTSSPPIGTDTPAPSAPLEVVPEPARGSARPLSADLAAALVGGLGSAPSSSLGASVGAGLRAERSSLSIEARADLPSSMSLRAGNVSTSLFTASLIPCLRDTYLAFCALATAGVLRAAGHNLVDSRQITLFYGAVGVRIAAFYPLTHRWSLALQGDAVAPLTETSLTVDGANVWSSSTLAFALGLGATANIP
jgi:hypothetical protein